MIVWRVITNQYFWLGWIILGALIVRLYKIDAPIADWHSWRQADTAAVTRNFVKDGFNPFLPKFDDMSGIAESPVVNLSRLRFVEFPLYNLVVYPIYLTFGVNEMYHRLVSVFFSLGSLVFVYLIAKRYADQLTAFIAAIIFAFLPYNVFFSRTTLPEPTFVFLGLGMVYFVAQWIEEDNKNLLWLAFTFTALAFLVKPWAIFFFLPLIYLVFKKEGKIWPINLKYPLFLCLSLIPFIFWRLWILQQPEGIPASSWLLNSDGIRFRPAFWWWIISERIGREILGASGVVLFYLGVLIKLPRSKSLFLHLLLLSALLFMVVFATGNVRHDYYQISFTPIASILTALGFTYLITRRDLFVPRLWTIPFALLFFVLTFYFGWVQVKGFYQINNPAILEAGKRADQLLPKDAVVIAPYNGDTAFLYQTNRAGFPFSPLPVTEMVTTYGVTGYVSVAKDSQTKWVMRHFKVLEEKPNYVIIDLTTPTRSLPDQLDPET